VKNLQKKKETNDKFYEEREAKLREIEFSKKLNELKEIHKKKWKNLKKREFNISLNN